MTEPKFKLGDGGELEEIIDDLGEKPKRKRKPYNRTLYIPMSLMLALIVGVAFLGGIAVYFTRSSPASLPENMYLAAQPQPTETPGGIMDQPPCAMLPAKKEPHIVYSIEPSGSDLELLRMNADGTNNCSLTNNNIFDGEPAWSPDGTRIVYSSFFYSASYDLDSQLYIMNANGENIKKLTSGFAGVNSPAWSPDGQKIVFQGQLKGTLDTEIFVIHVDGTNLVNLTNDPQNNEGAPNWSPDGQSIVFISAPLYQYGTPSEIDQTTGNEIFMMNENGGNRQQLTDNDLPEDYPSWSPDGQWLAFISEDSIYIMDKNGKQVRRLAKSFLTSSPPVWTPDSNEVGYAAYVPAVIQFVNIHSGQKRSLLVPDIPRYVAAWWPPAS